MEPKPNLPEEKLKLFNLIIKDLRTAIKNSQLYPPSHPIFNFSIRNFKTSLDKWFRNEDKMDLGISQDNLLLDGSYIKEKEELYSEIADYLHSRGIVAIYILKEIDTEELIEFFKFIRNDVRIIREKEGVLKNIPQTPHLKIKEIDYSDLLVSAKSEITDEEQEIWRSLCEVAEESRKAKLPDTKYELLIDFLKNPKKSASVLNKIYKAAVTKQKGEMVIKSIREVIARVYTYFEKNLSQDVKEATGSITHIIAGLDPSLLAGLFEQAPIDGRNFDLAKEITKNVSDNTTADFMVSLISEEGAFDERLLKVFDKLTLEKDRASTLASAVANKLFKKKLLNIDALSKLQLSIKDVFKANPNNNFMSEMYKLTVDTFVSRRKYMSVIAEKLSPLISEYVELVEKEKLKREGTRLLLDIIWLEEDPAEFKKFSTRLIDSFPEILDSKDAKCLKEIFELFIERLHPEQQKNEEIDLGVKEILKKITSKGIIERIISFIPELDKKDLEDTVYILVKTKANSITLVVDAFVSEKDQLRKHKFGSLLSMMKKDVSEEIMRRMENCDFSDVRDLFRILKEVDPEKAHLVTRKLIWHKNAQIRLEALENFNPETTEERNSVLELFRKERNEEIQNKAIAVLLKTRNKEIIDGLFRYTERNFLKWRFLLKLIESCGYLKVHESLPHLRKLLLNWSLVNTKKTDELRIASAVSLRQLGTTEAMEPIKKGLNSRRDKVRNMCNIIMELQKNKMEKGLEQGVDINGTP